MEQNVKLMDQVKKKIRKLHPEQLKELIHILDTWDKGELREFKRLRTRIPIDVVVDDRYMQAGSEDISAGGVFINVSGRFEVDADARLVFSFPGQDRPFKLKGRIVRVEEEGIAIEFDKISPYFKNILDEVIWDQP